ncbi:MAG TPA: hypothetical protein DEB06_11695 [Phycisphaerales bacterium]|nr:hypothetical protein [Phycisphaerales bacterium]
MASFCANVSIVLIILVVGMWLRNIFARSWDTLSWRNLFLLGMIQFYFLSAYFSASGEYTATLHHGSDEAFFLLALLMPVFVLLFVGAAHLGFRWTWAARLIPKAQMAITTPALLAVAGAMMSLALLFSVAPVPGFIGLLMGQIRSQLACVAMGLATYYLISRRFNPLSWGVFLTTLAVATIIGTVGLTGRRYMLGILLVIPWMWYFAVWRYRSGTANFIRFSSAAALGFLAIVIYSPLRAEGSGKMASGATFERRAQQLTELVTNPKIDTSVIKFIVYADTAPNTLFILDGYPSIFPHMPFHGLVWFVTNPIPRSVWAGKPEALGAILRDQMGVAPNLGPGIIGHGWAEGGWLGVVGYALVFGLIFGGVDRALSDRARNPYFIAVMGSCLGNVIAVPRGDTPLFMLQITGGIVISFAIVALLRATVGPIVSAFPSIEFDPDAARRARGQFVDADPEGEAPDEPWSEYDAEPALVGAGESGVRS